MRKYRVDMADVGPSTRRRKQKDERIQSANGGLFTGQRNVIDEEKSPRERTSYDYHRLRSTSPEASCSLAAVIVRIGLVVQQVPRSSR